MLTLPMLDHGLVTLREALQSPHHAPVIVPSASAEVSREEHPCAHVPYTTWLFFINENIYTPASQHTHVYINLYNLHVSVYTHVFIYELFGIFIINVL